MVPIPECEGTAHHWFQYSLCRVVLMVVCSDKVTPDLAVVSVLALSSRFDGPLAIYRHLTHQAPVSVLALSSRFDGRFVHGTYRRAGKVSVLALSSRFDGLDTTGVYDPSHNRFQYSLCRVVLMVKT